MKAIIREAFQKIKAFGAESNIPAIALIMLIIIAAFALGRLTSGVLGQGNTQEAQISHVEAKNTAEMQVKATEAHLEATPGGMVVGAKNGSKYYFPWCGGARRIKTENLVTFPNPRAAEAAGYTKAENCAGL